ncbi:MAG: Uma2 family endonuclease, partial [Anaerolineae bacterium]|nr:Uma2 family endonuclease [Anaerolineae bacterium]
MAVGNAKRLYTAEAFEALALSPDNAERRLELIGGEVVDVVSNVYASRLAARILGALVAYLDRNPLGDVTGADGGYCVGDDRYIPDVGYMAKARQPDPPLEAAYNPLPPDLAVEVLSPTDSLPLVMD